MKITSTNLIIITIFLFSSLFVYSQNNTAPFIRVISPNGGEKWEANSTQAITWESSGVDSVKIEYSFSAGLVWHSIAASVNAASGEYFWNVPNVQIDEVLIKVGDVNNSSLYDISDNQFKIYINNQLKRLKNLNQVTATSSTAVKIMPLGDSITQGDGNDSQQVGYRSKLFDLLQTAGYNFDFVGTQSSGTSYSGNPNFNPHHEGHGGYETMPPSSDLHHTLGENIWRNIIKNSSNVDTAGHWLLHNHPDVILLHIGTNDLDFNGTDCYGNFNNKPPATIASDIHKILDTVKIFDSNITTFLAKIIYNSHSTATADSLNKAIQAMYNGLSSPQKEKVKLVNTYDTVTYSADFSPPFGIACSFADLHPIQLGYDKMAGKWFLALQNYLPLLQLKVFLQGPYTGGGLMSLGINSLLPTTSPYQDINNNSAYLNGSNYVVVPYSIPSDITDWVQIEIRNSDGTTVVESKSCFLRDNGQVIDPDGLSENISLGSSVVNPLSTYYIVVKHRNHLAVMSSDLVELNGLTSYDFTTNGSAQGTNPEVTLSDGNLAMWAGDVNGDEYIDGDDVTAIFNAQGSPGNYLIQDLTDDNYVDGDDVTYTFNNQGNSGIK